MVFEHPMTSSDRPPLLMKYLKDALLPALFLQQRRVSVFFFSSSAVFRCFFFVHRRQSSEDWFHSFILHSFSAVTRDSTWLLALWQPPGFRFPFSSS